MHIKSLPFSRLALAAVAAGVVRAEDEPEGLRLHVRRRARRGPSRTAPSRARRPSRSPSPSPTSISIGRRRCSSPKAARKPASLKIVRAINANHFLEVVNEGFLNLTTVYDKDATSGTYPAVHSRHFGVLGQPVVAQYAGTCTAK